MKTNDGCESWIKGPSPQPYEASTFLLLARNALSVDHPVLAIGCSLAAIYVEWVGLFRSWCADPTDTNL